MTTIIYKLSAIKEATLLGTKDAMCTEYSARVYGVTVSCYPHHT
jgi:hypothetical protein